MVAAGQTPPGARPNRGGRVRGNSARGRLSDQPPGLVARGVQQWASQTNGRRGGNSRQNPAYRPAGTLGLRAVRRPLLRPFSSCSSAMSDCHWAGRSNCLNRGGRPNYTIRVSWSAPCGYPVAMIRRMRRRMSVSNGNGQRHAGTWTAGRRLHLIDVAGRPAQETQARPRRQGE